MTTHNTEFSVRAPWPTSLAKDWDDITLTSLYPHALKDRLALCLNSGRLELHGIRAGRNLTSMSIRVIPIKGLAVRKLSLLRPNESHFLLLPGHVGACPVHRLTRTFAFASQS